MIWFTLAAVIVAAAPGTLPSSPTFASDSSWDRGRRENFAYAMTTADGTLAHQEVRLTVTKELIPGMSPEENGLADPHVLQMRYWIDAIGADSTHQTNKMAVVSFDRRTFLPIQFSALAHDSSGTRYVEAKLRGTSFDIFFGKNHPSNRMLNLAWDSDAVIYDSLPLWLRGLNLEIPERYSVRLLPTQLSAPGRDPALEPAVVEVIGPAGPPSPTSHGGLEADLHYEGKVDKLWFHPGPGHILLVWAKADGTTLTLKSQRRE